MKVAILTLVLVALAASVAYAAPAAADNEEADIEAFIKQLMKAEQVSEQDNKNAEIKALLAQQLQEEEDDDVDELAALQELIALQQDPLAKAQKKWRKWRKVIEIGKKIIGHVRDIAG